MAKTCATSEGDLLDTLCQHYYGHLVGSVEAVLDANQDWRMSLSRFALA